MVNVPNPINLSPNTSMQLGRLWVILILIGITLTIIGFIIRIVRG